MIRLFSAHLRPEESMPVMPTLIVDLHTHLFNARGMPLPGVIANAMGKDADESFFARTLARLINRLTDSAHLDVYQNQETDPDDVEAYARRIANVAADELADALAENMAPALQGSEARRLAQERMLQGDLHEILTDLDKALDEIDPSAADVPQGDDVLTWARRLVAKALLKLQELAVLKDDITNYAAFFFNMLHSEDRMFRTLVDGYGLDATPIQFVHHMMDMQMAYVTARSTEAMVVPMYSFATQVERMRSLARQNQPRLLGFTAFDPRREDWRARAVEARKMGFKGFKFYPAMGYLPYGDADATVRQRTAEFFEFCVDENMAVFTHCTPVGFETRKRLGPNADPLNWERLLASSSKIGDRLRLCFGHAGGGDAHHGDIYSPGWTADHAGWSLGSKTNYAVAVARLCRTYKHVYCEFAYLSQLIEGTAAAREGAYERFTANLGQALERQPGDTCDFGDKIAYGTDWHMPSMVRQQRMYLDVFLRLFDERSRFAAYRERFFWQNAYRYLEI
jgi:predicted TIM-barrel fold metal-dependent hydrolase